MSNTDYMKKLLKGTMEWKDLGTLTTDKFWIMPATPKFDENEKIPYITSKNIRGGNIDFRKTKRISHSDYLSLSRNRPILSGDILISMIGTIGEVARVKKTDLDFYGQNMYLIRLNEELINSDYFLHFFDSPSMKNYFNSVKNNSGQGYLKANDIEKLQIPLPPLNIQAKIVQVLDVFTDLITELTNELIARKQQYTHYRDKLLTFEEGKVEWKSLGEVTTINTGKKPSDVLDVATAYDYINAGTSRSGYSASSNSEGDAVTTPSRGQGGIGYVGYQKKPFWLGPLCYKIKSVNENLLINKYLLYFLQSRSQLLLVLKKEGGVPAVNKSDLAKLEIPILPLDEQKRIVAALDKFDSLTTSLTEGLPREIALRQQQYGYYRELLLNFPKPEVANHA